MKRPGSHAIANAMALLEPVADVADPEYKPRAAVMAKLFEFYGERSLEQLDRYIDALWCEVPVDWLALAVKRLVVTRVYPSLPTIGDVRGVARELAGMDRTVYAAGHGYNDAGHSEWPPFGRRHAVMIGQTEQVAAGAVPLLPAGAAQKALESGE